MIADEVTDHSVLCSCFCLRKVQRRVMLTFPAEARSEEVQAYSRAHLSLERRICFEFLLDVEVLHASSHVFGVRVDDVIDPFSIISFEAARDMILFKSPTATITEQYVRTAVEELPVSSPKEVVQEQPLNGLIGECVPFNDLLSFAFEVRI